MIANAVGKSLTTDFHLTATVEMSGKLGAEGEGGVKVHHKMVGR